MSGDIADKFRALSTVKLKLVLEDAKRKSQSVGITNRPSADSAVWLSIKRIVTDELIKRGEL
jgi:hypothetical protein